MVRENIISHVYIHVKADTTVCIVKDASLDNIQCHHVRFIKLESKPKDIYNEILSVQWFRFGKWCKNCNLRHQGRFQKNGMNALKNPTECFGACHTAKFQRQKGH